MSDIEITEMIEKDTGVKFSRMAIKKWRDAYELRARNPHDRFQLASDKNRFNHLIIAKKRNYKSRKMDYNNINKRRVKLMRSYKCRKNSLLPISAYAFGLERKLSKNKKSASDLASFLGVSTLCVKGWCGVHNKVNKIYWRKISNFLACPKTEIFDVTPTPSQSNRLERTTKTK